MSDGASNGGLGYEQEAGGQTVKGGRGGRWHRWRWPVRGV